MRLRRLEEIRFVQGRCQSCKGSGEVLGGPCFTCSRPTEEAEEARPCVLVLTSTPRSNGRQLRVRCECMSGVPSRRPVDHRTPYDHLGDVATIEEAVALWKEHQ